MSTSLSFCNTAILTVCVDTEMAERILAAAELQPWMLHTSDFGAYVSHDRRPHIQPAVKAAELCIAVIDFDANPTEAVVTAEYLQAIFAGKVALVALSDSADPATLLAAMRAGCSEFIHKTATAEELAQLLARLDRQRHAPAVRHSSAGSVLSFFGAKGGVGSTTLAVHLALYLTEVHGKKTLLIDNHSELGHVCVYLGIDGARFNFHELLRNVGRLDSDLLKGFTAKHSSGLEVLSSPDVCGSTREVDPESITRLLEFLKTEYDYVILDCATSLQQTNLAVIDGSTQVYLVATPEISAIRDLSRYVDNLMQIEYTTEKMHVVINRFSSRYAVNVEQIEKAIRLPVAVKLPNSYTELVRAVNLGEPISPKKKNEFTTQFLKWTSTIVGAETPRDTAAPVKKKSPFAFLSK
jgi:pilus assembly protein CpaE